MQNISVYKGKKVTHIPRENRWKVYTYTTMVKLIISKDIIFIKINSNVLSIYGLSYI